MKRLLLSFLLVISISAVPIHSATADIIQLTVASDHLSGYNRSLFKLWTDADRDGCNTRAEVLIAEAIVKPKVGKKCALTGGKWKSPYEGKITKRALDLDIDHLVPLAEAWRSGAWAWSALQRQNYANDLTEPKALVAVSLGLNRQKGDQDPSSWLPPKAKCRYISNWITVKYKYSLTVDEVEAKTLSTYISQCSIKNISVLIQSLTYLTALASFKGSNFEEFWSKHLPEQLKFKDQPQLIASLQLTQQLMLITGNHQALVNALQVKRKISTAHQLLELETGDWLALIKQTGIPDFVEGNSDEDKLHTYAEQLQGMLNAAFPTQRIAIMLQKNSFPIEKVAVTKSITSFLAQTTHFDFTTSRIHDFAKEIEAAAKGNFKEVRSELMKIQRVFQVSTSPAAMVTLLESKLHSAYTIANIPQKSFVKKYADGLGGERDALAIHQRATYISARAEMTATTIMEYANSTLPAILRGRAEHHSPTPAQKPSTTPTPAPTPTVSLVIKYANCTAAKAAGVTPIKKSTNLDLYNANAGLDRDKDGIACET